MFASIARWTLRQVRRLDQPCLRTFHPSQRSNAPVHLVLDSTGLQVYGEGEVVSLRIFPAKTENVPRNPNC